MMQSHLPSAEQSPDHKTSFPEVRQEFEGVIIHLNVKGL
jgi:hypothetical protein